MSEFRRARHRAVARVLEVLNVPLLERAHCFFGGGTRIALELGEYRESEDIDFICCHLPGYRMLRAEIANDTLGAIAGKLPRGITLRRAVRADQYGIRTVFDVEGEPVKFEIILEARIEVQGQKVKNIRVPVLDRTSCFAEKWLANADRWNDDSVLGRDAIDLAHMLMLWGTVSAAAGAQQAILAYGKAVAQCARAASTRLVEDTRFRKYCVDSLAVSDPKLMLAGLKTIPKVLKMLK